jgi:hypothetical protein
MNCRMFAGRIVIVAQPSVKEENRPRRPSDDLA